MSEFEYAAEILEHLDEGFVSYDSGFRFSYLNHSSETLLERDRKDLIGKVLWEEYPDLLGTIVETEYRLAMQTREIRQFEYWSTRASRWYTVRAIPSKFGGITVTFRDITARKQSEHTVEIYRALALESGQLGFWRWNKASGKVSWSPELEAMYGLPTGTFGGTIDAFFQLVLPDDRASLSAKIHAAIESDGAFQVQHRMVRADGVIRWVEGRGRVLRDQDGVAQGMAGVTWDVTDSRGEEHQLREILNGLFAMVWVVDTAGNIVNANRVALEACGVALAEIQGRPLLEYPGWSTFAPEQAQLQDALNRGYRGVTSRFDLRITSPSAGQLIVDFSVAPLLGHNGQTVLIICSAVTITERKEAEEALRDSQERLRLALTAGQMGIWVIDLLTGVVTASESADTLFGIESKSATRSLDDYLRQIHPDDRERVVAALNQTPPVESDHLIEFRVPLSDGTVRWLASRGEHIGSAIGDVYLFSGAIADITERRLVEEALRVSEERYRTLVEVVPQLVWTCLPDGQCDYLSRQWIEYTGIPEDEQLGLAWLKVLHPQDSPRALDAWFNAVREKAPYDLEYRIRGADGSYRWFKTRGVPVRNSEGKIVRWFGTCTDIEDTRQAAEEIREGRERLRAALAASTTGTFRWDLASDRIEADDSLDNLLGILDKEGVLTPDEFVAAIHPEDRELVHSRLMRCAQEGREVDAEFRVADPAAGTRWLAMKAKAAAQDGRLLYVTGAGVDITNRKRAEEELRATNRALVRINEDLEQFAYAASHDLQEPLRMVTSYTQLIARRYAGQLDPTADEFIAFAVQGAKQMESLIKGLLDYTRVAYEDWAPEGSADANQVLESVLNNLSSAIEESGARVTVTGTLPTVAIADVHLLQVLQNLIGNAIKYAGPEPPVVNVSATLENQEWQFCVSDNGRGFAPRYAERIFGMFKRLQKSGTGIGLAICRRIIERQGGRIWAESDEGKGARFYFTIPVAADPKSHLPHPQSGYPIQ